MTGLELKLLRVSRRVKLVDLARAMGTAHPNVSRLESLDRVPDGAQSRYLSALDRLTHLEDGPRAA